MFSLSVVIPSHNRPELLKRCLTSVLRHAPDKTQVIVVDDGSRTAAVQRVACGLAGVEVVRLPRARGFCAAANAGIRQASADVVELLNDDTLVTAGWAQAALSCFADPHIGAVAPLILAQGLDNSIDSAGDSYDVGGFARKRGHGRALTREHLSRRLVFGACGAAAFYRREALLRAGGFPERFGAYFDDVDLSFRIHWAGYQVLFEPASRVHHLGGASYGSPRRKLHEQQSRNEELVFWRNLPAPVLRRAAPRHLAVLTAKALRRWEEGALAPFLFGRLKAWREWASVLDHRRWLNHQFPPPATADWRLEGLNPAGPPPQDRARPSALRTLQPASAAHRPGAAHPAS